MKPTIEYINSRYTLATPNMAKQLTIEETNRMIAFANENFDCNSDVDQFIDLMVKEFFPDADIAIIKQIFEWSKYPDLKIIKVSDIMQIERDELTRQMKKRLNGTVCSNDEYQRYRDMLSNFNEPHLYDNFVKLIHTEIISFNKIIILLWHYPTNGYYTSLYTSRQHYLSNASIYLAYSCVIISIWETKKKDRFQSLLSSNAKMVKQIESLNGQLEYLQSQVYVSNAKMVKQIESLNGQLEYLQSQVYVSNNKISLLQTELHSIKARFTPELVEYDYEAIKSRLDPIREELKMAQRLFARIIRNQYQAPMAVLVGTKSCK